MKFNSLTKRTDRVVFRLSLLSVLCIGILMLSANYEALDFIFPFGKDVKVKRCPAVRPMLGCFTYARRPDFFALDIFVDSGESVGAIGSGLVTNAGYTHFGNWVEIRHNDSIVSHYYHLSKISVDSAQAVVKGQVIGFSGNTGLSTVPHLSLSILLNGKRVNPCGFIPCDRLQTED